jgi:hypothetical protein
MIPNSSINSVSKKELKKKLMENPSIPRFKGLQRKRSRK